MPASVTRPSLDEIMNAARKWGLNPTSMRAEGFALLERGDKDAARLVAYRLLRWTPEQWQGVLRAWREVHREKERHAVTALRG